MPLYSPWSYAVLAVIGAAALWTSPAASAIDPAGAEKIFAEAQGICDRDKGAFWGLTLCGPILLVDPNDQTIVTNQMDAGGVLKAAGPGFVGVLPASAPISDSPLHWSGIRWTELMWPLPDQVDKRHVTLAHEMFHRIQPDLGLLLAEGNNQHLDTLQGRYLIQLEWRALAKALVAPTNEARRTAIGDAILFRSERYRLFPGAAAGEQALEANEGVAEYTGVRLGLETPEKRTGYAVQDLSAFLQASSFVRTFAYAEGPAYGLLLDQADPQWRSKLGTGQGLYQLLGSALQLPPPAFAALKVRAQLYDDASLLASETKREEERQKRLAAFRAKFVDGPVLAISLHHVDWQFSPQSLQALDDVGTVYPTLRLSGRWGVLEVDNGGALMTKDMELAKVSAANIDLAHLTGAGWRLSLKSGWTVNPGARPGDFVLVPSGPTQP